ncbi:MAG: RnfABCDGE type electron transport complex subunit D [Bacilli bacterium]
MTTFVTSPGPFLRNPVAQTKRAMRDYTLGLIGLFIFSIAFHGLTHGIEYAVKGIGMMVTSLIVTLLADLFVAALRYQHQNGRLIPYFITFVKKHYSYVTAVILTLTLPIGTPYYVLILGNLFSTLLVKYTFGGFGMNIFNPAAFGRIFVGLAFGGQLTAYLDRIQDVPSLSQTGQTITTVFASTYPNWIASNLEGMPVNSLWQLILGNYSGALGETSVLLIVILGSILTILKAHNWRPTVFFLFTVWFGAFGIALAHQINPLWYAFTFVSLGSVFFGGMFMLTDPVTSPTSNFGKSLIGVIAGIVVLLVRTQTSLPEGMVYGIAVANLVSPVIDHYTVGLTSQFLKQRYALLSGLMVFAVGVTVLPTLVVAETNSSPSSSEVVVIPYATYRGRYTGYFHEYDENPTELIVDVGVDREFHIVKLDLIQGITSSEYTSIWQSSKQSILNQYLAMNVKTLLEIDEMNIPENLTITGASTTTSRLLKAMQQAFENIIILEGSASSYACDECDEPDTVQTIIYVDETNDEIQGIDVSGILATSQPYLGVVQNELEDVLDYFIGMTVLDVLNLSASGPLYPNFNPTGSGATISFTRIFDAILNTLGAYYG